MAQFPFNDFHSFKDFVIFVRMCCPDQFPLRDGVAAEDQWTLELAFQGLRFGISKAIEEKGKKIQFDECVKLIDEAYGAYLVGDRRTGFGTLDKMHKLLKQIRSV